MAAYITQFSVKIANLGPHFQIFTWYLVTWLAPGELTFAPMRWMWFQTAQHWYQYKEYVVPQVCWLIGPNQYIKIHCNVYGPSQPGLKLLYIILTFVYTHPLHHSSHPAHFCLDLPLYLLKLFTLNGIHCTQWTVLSGQLVSQREYIQ